MTSQKLKILDNDIKIHFAGNKSLTVDEQKRNSDLNVSKMTVLKDLKSGVEKVPSNELEKVDIMTERRPINPKVDDTPLPEQVIDNKTDMPSKTLRVKAYLQTLIDSNIFLCIMTLCTLFALFSNDFQYAFLPLTVDIPFDVVQTFLFFLFSVEIVLTMFVKPDYIGSFFFWLDLLSTISLLQDISWAFGSYIVDSYIVG
jgi:hypothetical protein